MEATEEQKQKIRRLENRLQKILIRHAFYQIILFRKTAHGFLHEYFHNLIFHKADQIFKTNYHLRDAVQTQLVQDQVVPSPKIQLSAFVPITFRKNKTTAPLLNKPADAQSQEQFQHSNLYKKQNQSIFVKSIPISLNNTISDISKTDQEIELCRHTKRLKQNIKVMSLMNRKQNAKATQSHGISVTKFNTTYQKIKRPQHYVQMKIGIRNNQNDKIQRQFGQKGTKTSKGKRLNKNKYRPIQNSIDKSNRSDSLKAQSPFFQKSIASTIHLQAGVNFRGNKYTRKHQLTDNIKSTTKEGNYSKDKSRQISTEKSIKRKLLDISSSNKNPIQVTMKAFQEFKKQQKITSMMYCTTMKTVKDLNKTMTASKNTIQSIHHFQTPTQSKKLVRINRKLFAQFFTNDDNQPQINSKNNRVTRNKVRFNTILKS